MKPEDFPYARFSQFKAEKDAALEQFVKNPTWDDIPVVIQPPIDIWGAVAADRQASLERQLAALALSMQLQSDFAFTYLEPWHGVGVYANIFGCPVNWNDFDAPQTLPVIHQMSELDGLKRPRILDAELPRMILETIRYYRQVTGDRLDIVLTDTQSPNDSASLIMDTSEFFAASLAEPERLAPFMTLLTDVMIEFSEMQFEAMGRRASRPGHIHLSSPNLGGISISDDNMAVISAASYRNSALPYNSSLGEHFGGLAVHTCGNFAQNYAVVKQVKNLVMVDCALGGVDPQPNRADKLGQAFAGSGVILKVRIGGEAYWDALEDLIRPDLRLIVQFASDGDVARSNQVYEQLKQRCRQILARKQAQARDGSSR